MAILRSRSPTVESGVSTGQPMVNKEIAAWHQRVEKATQEGRALGVQDAQANVQAAEARAVQAEQAAKSGIAKATADAEARLGGAITSFAKASAALEKLHHQLVLEAEADSVRLACLLAARILGRTVEEDPSWMVPVLTKMLAQVPDRRAVTVRMHPTDAAAAREHLTAISANTPGLENLSFSDDKAVGRGGCIIASQGTRLDASIPASFDRLSALLLAQIPVPVLSETAT